MNEVGVAKFKANLSRYLRDARSGTTITITDRGTAVARLVATTAEPIRVVPPARSLRDLPLPAPAPVQVDVVAALLEERQRERSSGVQRGAR